MRSIFSFIRNRLTSLFLFLPLFLSCSTRTDPPEPYGAVPTRSHLLWHQMEYFSLVCYGLNTYTEVEWAYGDVDPELFNPSNLDTDQWARVARDAGMKGLILVAKHHDGFCLWPSRYTDYSVKATPWMNGEGDVLGDLAASCKKYGLKLGVYLSPWDRNHAEYGREAYVQYYYDQLEELLTGYGDIFEFWIDGANGGTGYYGGADERRTIDRETYYGYDTIFSMVKSHQPDALIFSDVGPGVRWVGNESGYVNETNWNTINTGGAFPGSSEPEFHKKLGTGDKDGSDWIPAEVNTTLLWPKAWYYHSDSQPRSLSNLMDLYYTSIGRGSPLDLGIAIAPTGEIRETDVKALLKFKQQVDREFRNNLIGGAKLTSSETRGNATRFAAAKVQDEDSETYWATSDSIQKASLVVDFQNETTFNRLMMQEYIALGQRIDKFTAEAFVDEEYIEIATGTTIGYKRALRLEDVTTSRLRITFETDAPCLTLSNLGVYNAPPLVDDPEPVIDEAGNLFTVLNWNTLYCFNHGKAVDRGAEWIRNQRTNVVALQELNGQTHESFKKLARKWDHDHAVLLKEEGFPVGLSSDKPIEVIERRVEGFHHGFLHCKTYGIHFLVIHLWPGKDQESVIITDKAKELMGAGEKVIVLGDFNAESILDQEYHASKPALKSKVEYTVLNRYADIDLVDLTHKHDPGALVSFPSPIVIPRWHEDMESVRSVEHRIDFILTSQDLEENSRSATILRSAELDKISDHYPVIARFRFGF